MIKYFFKGNYTAQGVQGLVKEGGSARVDAVAKLAASLGGKLEFFHFSAGTPTYYGVFSLPDPGAAASLAATVIGSGAVTVDECVPILNGEQMDAALGNKPTYRAPGR
jgi:uncharacterized protein with GYD domain